MKNYKKAVLASLATIGASCALIGGATFALFTSDSTTNIAVTSGKVDVRAVVLDETIELTSMGKPMDETFEVGGTAEYVKDTNTFVIDGMVAGDYIEFDIEITNYSTVAVKYQSKVSYEGEKALFNALDFTIEDLEFATIGDEAFTSWENLTVGSEAIVKHVTMGIPEEYDDKIVNGDDTNSIQGKTCNITFNVTAVQGNATVVDPIDTEAVLARLKEKAVFTKSSGSYADYVKSLEIETEEELIVLGTTDTTWLHPNNPRDNTTTITITNDLNFAGYTWVPLNVKDVIFSGGAQGVTISNIDMGNTNAAWAGFVSYANNVAFENLTFKNVTVSGAQAGALAGHWSGGANSKVTNVTLDGNINVNYVANVNEDYPGIGIFCGAYAEGNTTVTGCEIAKDAVVTLNFGDDYKIHDGGVATEGNIFGVKYGGTIDIEDGVVNNGSLVQA